jgi:hypothetical protein
MAYCVARDVQKIERAVAEVIKCLKISNIESGRKGDFMQIVVPMFDFGICAGI